MENEQIIQHIMSTPDNSNPNVIRDMLRSNSGGGTSGMRGADWAAEEGEDGFIENKPFRATVTGGTETVFDDQVTAEHYDYLPENRYLSYFEGVLIDGEDIIVTVDGTEYQMSNTSQEDGVSYYGDGDQMNPDFTRYPVYIEANRDNQYINCASNVQNFSLKIQKDTTTTDIYMSDEFEMAMADRVGYTVKEESNVLFDGPLTGTNTPGPAAYVANITPGLELGDAINVIYTAEGGTTQTFTNLEPRQSGTRYTYGAAIYQEAVDFSEYPFMIDGDSTLVQVLTADESYTITIESAANTTTVETTENFKKAVKSVAGEGSVVIQGTDANGNLVTGATVQGGISADISANNKNVASGTYSHAENGGYYDDNYDDYGWFPTTASGASSHAEGLKTVASGVASHAEGRDAKAIGNYAHAEGNNTTASEDVSHAEGSHTTASGSGSHAEGSSTRASGGYAHAEGSSSTASGTYAHAESNSTTASGIGSHAEGHGTIANHAYQHVFGEFNVADESQASATTRGQYVEIVGKGLNDGSRANARTLDWSGNEVLSGSLKCGSAGITIGSTTVTEAQLQALLALLNT